MDITVNELKDRMNKGTTPPMIDVREPHEYDTQHLEGAPNLPLGDLPTRITELEGYKDLELVLYCRSGGRSGRACDWLRAQGFKNVRNLIGGMLAWKTHIEPGFNVS